MHAFRPAVLLAVLSLVLGAAAGAARAQAGPDPCDCRAPLVTGTDAVLGPDVGELITARLGWTGAGDLPFAAGRVAAICLCPSTVAVRGTLTDGERPFLLLVAPPAAAVLYPGLRRLVADETQQVHADVPAALGADAALVSLTRTWAPLPWREGAAPPAAAEGDGADAGANGPEAPGASAWLLGAALLLLLAGGLALVVRGALAALDREGRGRVVFAVLAVLALSVALRIALATPWPTDQMEVVRLREDPLEVARAGTSLFYAMVWPLTGGAADPLRAASWLNLALSAATPALLLLWLTLVAGRAAGVLAGLLLAADPTHVRLALTGDSCVAFALLAVAAALQLELAIRDGRRRGSAAAGLLWALTITMRPESAVILVVPFTRVLVDAAARARLRTWRWSALLVAPPAVVLALKLALMASSYSLADSASVRTGVGDMLQRALSALFVHHEVWRLPLLSAVALLGALAMGVRRAAPLLAAAFIGPAVVLHSVLWDDRLTGYRYFLGFLPFLLAAVSGLAVAIDRRWPARLRAAALRPALGLLLALAPAALLLEGAPDLDAVTPFQLEHVVLEEAVAALPSPSVVVVFSAAREAGPDQLVHRLRAAGRRVRSGAEGPPPPGAGGAPPDAVQVLAVPPLDPAALAQGGPVYYYRGWLENRPLGEDLSAQRALHAQLAAAFEKRPVHCRARPAFWSWRREALDRDGGQDAPAPLNDGPRPVYEYCLYRLWPKSG